MWNWIKRRWSRGRRGIFQYWDGTAWRYADPMVIVRGLQDHPRFSWSQHPVEVTRGDVGALKICADAVRDVFGIGTFDGVMGSGLTEQECLELLGTFSAYLTGVKKNGNPSLTSPAPTVPASSPPSTEPTPTNAVSDSGSTSTASEPGSPSP